MQNAIGRTLSKLWPGAEYPIIIGLVFILVYLVYS